MSTDPKSDAIALRTKQDAMIAAKFGERGIVLADLAQAKAFAMEIAESGIAPVGMNKPGAILLAMQTGMELGLSPMQALQSIVVVNGRASLMGTAAIALIERSGLLDPEAPEVLWGSAEDENGQPYGYCRTKRKGRGWKETIFTKADAETARLWNKDGPWKQYPKRMLAWRAVGFHFRDHWTDVGKGMVIDVEARDIEPRMRDVTPVRPAERAPAPDPLFGDRPSEPILEAQTIPADEAELEIDPETGEVIPPGVGVPSWD